MDVKRETSYCSAQTKTEENYKEEIKPRIKDEDNNSESSSPKQETSIMGQEENELETAKAEMGEVKEENERLKKMLERIENDYKALQMRFFDILKRSTISEERIEPQKEEEKEEEEEEPEVSLSLGLQVLSKKRKTDDNQSTSSCVVKEDVKMMSDGLSLGLELELRGSPTTIDLSDKGSEQNAEINEDDDDGAKEDNTGETWPPSKVLKTVKDDDFKEEESSQRNTTKRARVSVRARCDTPTMNDGCQWRKYGQKIAKGNPCPRAYYRCTVAQSCPVRKQVQRCSDDTSILITTYEGTHNHPLSSAATAMASTTSAAASILLSGSSTSNSGVLSPSSTPTMSTTNLNGLHFNLYHHNNNNSRNNSTAHFNLPNSSSPLPPTITLDLTSSPSSHFNRHRHTASSSNFLQSPLFSHTFSSSSSSSSSRSLDFSSSETKPNFPLAWSNNINNSNTYLNYASLFPSNNKTTPIIGSINFGSKPTFEQPNYLERMNQTATSSSSSSSSQQFLTETLTKVLTSDPSFQSAVAAAISSMVGSTNHNLTNNSNLTSIISGGNTENSNHNLKWIDQNGKGCAPTYLNNPNSSSTTTSNSQPAGNLMLLHPPFPFSLSKSSSSPDLRD